MKMKSYLLFTVTGTKVIITSYDSVEHPEVLKKLRSKGISKFIAYEVSIESTRAKYGKQLSNVYNETFDSNDIMILDCIGECSPEKFSFNELSNPTFYEPMQDQVVDIYMVGV